MRYFYLVIAALILLSACTTTETNPEDLYITVSVGSDPGRFQILTLEEPKQDSAQANWDSYRNNLESTDHFIHMNNVREVEDHPFNEQEEDRIEQVCEDMGYSVCYDIVKTCEKDGCHRVEVTCEDNDWDENDDLDECNVFDVYVDPEIDDDLTDQEAASQCEDNAGDPYFRFVC